MFVIKLLNSFTKVLVRSYKINNMQSLPFYTCVNVKEYYFYVIRAV